MISWDLKIWNYITTAAATHWIFSGAINYILFWLKLTEKRIPRNTHSTRCFICFTEYFVSANLDGKRFKFLISTKFIFTHDEWRNTFVLGIRPLITDPIIVHIIKWKCIQLSFIIGCNGFRWIIQYSIRVIKSRISNWSIFQQISRINRRNGNTLATTWRR